MTSPVRTERWRWGDPAVLWLALALAGCGGPPADAPSGSRSPASSPDQGEQAGSTETQGPLADTEWRLVEFQSMDDATGTVAPEEPSRYTMRLAGDGTVSMRLDCNRATGTWSAEPGDDPTSGRFEIGPLAATRALCPPPRLDEWIVAQAPYVRSYLLADGRLYLSLMADGGIFAWEPVLGEAFRTEPDAALERAILAASPDYTREVAALGTGPARYVYGTVDLNGDGQDEVLVYMLGSIFCGTGGCTLLLFKRSADGYARVDAFPITRLPIIVPGTATDGWKDIIRPESGGGAQASYVRHVWDGTRYVEQERLPADPPPQGMRYLVGELSFEQGIPLAPPAGRGAGAR